MSDDYREYCDLSVVTSGPYRKGDSCENDLSELVCRKCGEKVHIEKRLENWPLIICGEVDKRNHSQAQDYNYVFRERLV